MRPYIFISCITLFAATAKGAIIVRSSIDPHSLTISDFGGDTISLTINPSILPTYTSAFRVSSGDTAIMSYSPPEGGSNITFFQDISVDRVPSSLGISVGVVFHQRSWLKGADLGFNYTKLDLDKNGVYETVVEFEFGSIADSILDDKITRYAFDESGLSLSFPDALAAFEAVPEPSSSAMIAVFLIGCASSRSRK